MSQETAHSRDGIAANGRLSSINRRRSRQRHGENVMKKTFPVLVTLVALGFGATTAMARSPERPALPTFEQLDSNQSGSVTLEDFQAYFASRVGAMQDDTIAKLMERAGEDGKLDEAGLRAGLESLREERRNMMRDGGRGHDGDHGRKGRDSRADRGGERGQMGERMFGAMDANKDGSVDAAEYEAFTKRMAERMQQRGEGRRGWWN
jgi:Ca2+-binding EF-hand superfamily protein